MDRIEKLIAERLNILSEEANNKRDIIECLMEQNMTDFFSVNWSKLYRQFGGIRSNES